MDFRYLQFVSRDAFFYGRRRETGAVQDRPLALPKHNWEGWVIHSSPSWTMAAPRGVALPKQGWKIHVTSTSGSAQDVLDITAIYAQNKGLAFKFSPSLKALETKNGKLAPRAASGKFITLYPTNDAATVSALDDLDRLLRDFQGPRILGDLLWRQGPVSVRYGGFQQRFVDVGLGRHLALESPTGLLEEDRRGVRFNPPAWLRIPPAILAEKKRADSLEPGRLAEFEIESAIRFSNAGGIYRGRRRKDGLSVVLKEARPLAGLDTDGTDAVTRLQKEESYLRALGDIEGVVRVEDAFWSGGHRFLVLQEVSGVTLSRHLFRTNPLLSPGSWQDDYVRYRDEALSLVEQVETVVASIHEHGVLHGDLHPDNIMISSDGGITILDFEAAAHADCRPAPIMGVPGYVAPADVAGAARDTFSLASIALNALVPLSFIHHLDEGKSAEHLRFAQDAFGLTDSVVASLAERMRFLFVPERKPSQMDVFEGMGQGHLEAYDEAREAMARSIEASSGQGDEERYFPGDIKQYDTSAVGLAFGVSGVVHAMRRGDAIMPAARAWMISRALGEEARPGLLDGIAGCLLALGGENESAALEVSRRLGSMLDTVTRVDLFGGLSGIGLALLSRSSDSPSAEQSAAVHRIADVLLKRPLVDDEPVGLFHGRSGQALFLTRYAARFSDHKALDRAEELVRADLSNCVLMPDGSIQVNDGQRALIYVERGSAGIGMALLELLHHVDASDLRHSLVGIERAAWTPFTINSGLATGRAGLIHFLADLQSSSLARAETRTRLLAHVRDLSLHAIRYQGGLAFPGEQFLRLSSDWATGTAGVVSAIGAVRDALASESSPTTASRWETSLFRSGNSRLATESEW